MVLNPYYRFRLKRGVKIRQVGWLSAACLLTRRDILEEVGLFDEINIKQCADTELPVRANFKFGYQLFVCYDAIIFSHLGDKTNINSKNYEIQPIQL